MQSRKTLIALLVLVAIGGLAYYVSRQPVSEKSHKLFDLTAADIAQIELRGPARDLIIKRDGPSLWKIVKPVETDADNGTADGLANAIAGLEIVDTVDENPADLGNFGLANPATTIIVTTTDNKVLPGIMVGSGTPVGNNAYFKTTDKPAVLLTNAGFTVAAGRTLKDLRSKILVNLTASEMNRVDIVKSDGSEIELVRKGDDWMFTKPRVYGTDKAAVQQLLNVIAGTRVAEFIEDNPTDLDKFGLAKPSLSFEVDGGKDNSIKEKIEIGFKQPEAAKSAVYVRVGEGDRPIATVADYIVKAVDKTFDDLRDKSVLPFDKADVARMTVVGGPLSILVERAPNDKWNVVAEGKTLAARPEVASSLLDQLHDLKGTTIVMNPMTDPKPFGMERPTVTATLYDHSGKEIGSIYASEVQATMRPDDPSQKPRSQNFGYATSSADKAVYMIQPEQVIDLENTASTLKSEVEPKLAPGASPVANAAPPATANPAPPPDMNAMPPTGAGDLPPPGAIPPPTP
jgi:hypothetical protein